MKSTFEVHADMVALDPRSGVGMTNYQLSQVVILGIDDPQGLVHPSDMIACRVGDEI